MSNALGADVRPATAEPSRDADLLDAQNTVLELIIKSAPLKVILGSLCRIVEAQADGDSIAAILLIDSTGTRLVQGAAPSLPDAYNKAIDGLKICAGIGTCLDAAARKVPVITPDFATAESWKGLAHLPLELGLKGAWSMPILSSSGDVLGTFGTYFKTARQPTPRERQLVGVLSHTAALAIERDHHEQEQRKADAERLQLLASERAARGEAERASRMKDEFLATLSHELRTPLNAILGWAHLLKSGKIKPELAAEGLNIIERNSRVQSQLIEDLLDMSRIISGKIRLDVRRVNVNDVISAAIESVRSAADAKMIHLASQPEDATLTVMGDAGRLQQVVWNLLSNAIKFTPRDGLVQVHARQVHSLVEISVKDSGKGIKPEFLSHVFERFRQADGSTTKEHGGLGLGLAIVKQLVELHGGDVRVHSEGEGTGATFTVALPIAAVVRTPETSPSAFDAHALPLTSLRGVRVLVVDDEPDSALLVARVLEGCDAEVRKAGSVVEAMSTLQTFVPHVILSDIGMPGQDGYELIRRIRLIPGLVATPAVALTALARSEDRMRALNAGFQTHLAKPVEVSELIAVVASLATITPG